MSRPVKLKSVKNGKIFQWLSPHVHRVTRPQHHPCSVHRTYASLITLDSRAWIQGPLLLSSLLALEVT